MFHPSPEKHLIQDKHSLLKSHSDEGHRCTACLLWCCGIPVKCWAVSPKISKIVTHAWQKSVKKNTSRVQTKPALSSITPWGVPTQCAPPEWGLFSFQCTLKHFTHLLAHLYTFAHLARLPTNGFYKWHQSLVQGCGLFPALAWKYKHNQFLLCYMHTHERKAQRAAAHHRKINRFDDVTAQGVDKPIAIKKHLYRSSSFFFRCSHETAGVRSYNLS